MQPSSHDLLLVVHPPSDSPVSPYPHHPLTRFDLPALASVGLALSSLHPPSSQSPISPQNWGTPYAGVQLDHLTLTAHAAPTHPDPLFLRQLGSSLYLSNRTYLLPPSDISPHGLYALLQYGAVPAPYSILQHTSRVRPGTRHVYTLPSLSPTVQPYQTLSPTSVSTQLSPDQLADELRNSLDDVLQRLAPTNPLLLFSGGVDSSLLAYRCAELGYADSALVNFKTHAHDTEPEIAAKVAQALGLRVDHRYLEPRDLVPLAEEEILAAPQPFVDTSSLPTTGLLSALGPVEPGRRVLDGTGADGGFGMVALADRWQRAARFPPLAFAARLAYSAGAYAQTGRLERTSRILKRISEKPLLSAVLAQNALLNIAYSFPPEVTRDVDQAVHALPEHALGRPDLPWAHRMIVGDLILTCSGVFAQKTFTGLLRRNLLPVYPFLASPIVNLALAWAHPPQSPLLQQPKAPLKTLLTRKVPHELVYRKKSGFVSDLPQQLALPSVLARLDAALSHPDLRPFLRPAAVTKLVDRVKNRDPLGDQTYNFLWALFVAHLYASSRKPSPT